MKYQLVSVKKINHNSKVLQIKYFEIYDNMFYTTKSPIQMEYVYLDGLWKFLKNGKYCENISNSLINIFFMINEDETFIL